MQILSSDAVRIGNPVRQGTLSVEPELTRLQALVARLQAERAAPRWAAGHDELTGLPNRRLFTALVLSLLDGRPAVVFVLDLDGFTPVNDRFGRDAGDRILCFVAQRLAAWAGDHMVARLGGDEFAGVLTGPPTNHQWWYPAIAELAATISEPMPVAGHLLTVRASIGLAHTCGQAQLADLLHRANLAMYQAKRHMRSIGNSKSAWICGPMVGDDAITDTIQRPRSGQRR
jgi:diguanylate cyclase (GGDEF)-like protein